MTINQLIGWLRITKESKNILIIKTHAIGDVLMVTPSVRAIRKAFPSAHISVLVGNWSKEAVTGNPHINEILTFDDSILHDRKLIQTIQLIYRLRKKKYDYIFIFHHHPIIHLFAFLLRGKNRVGFSRAHKNLFLTKSVPLTVGFQTYKVESFMRIPRAIGIEIDGIGLDMPTSSEDHRFAKNYLKENDVKEGELLIGICPGGAVNPNEDVPERRWDVRSYAILINNIWEKYGAKIIIFGGKTDIDIVNELMDLTDNKPINACAKSSLKQSAALIEKCSMILTNDSSPLHIAIAKGTSTISLFGPTCGITRVPQNYKHRIIQSNSPCSPCNNFTRFPGCVRKKPDCMESISVERVFETLEKHLGNNL